MGTDAIICSNNGKRFGSILISSFHTPVIAPQGSQLTYSLCRSKTALLGVGDRYLPKQEEIISCLQCSEVFTVMDLTKGFLQQPIRRRITGRRRLSHPIAVTNVSFPVVFEELRMGCLHLFDVRLDLREVPAHCLCIACHQRCRSFVAVFRNHEYSLPNSQFVMAKLQTSKSLRKDNLSLLTDVIFKQIVSKLTVLGHGLQHRYIYVMKKRRRFGASIAHQARVGRSGRILERRLQSQTYDTQGWDQKA